MKGAGQNIVLPQNIKDALLANPSSPSGSNAFVTFADLSGSFDGIYTADGTTFPDVDVTVDGQMNWIVTSGNEMAFGPTAFIPSGTYHFKSATSPGTFFDAVGNTSADYAIRARQGDGTSLLQARGGLVEVVPLSGQFKVGSTLASTSLFTVTGDGTTDATINTLLQDSGGTDRFIMADNGHLSTGSGPISASLSATFGQWHLNRDYTYGFGFYGYDNSGSVVLIQGKSTTNVALRSGFQDSPTGTVIAVEGTSNRPTGSINRGGHFISRDGLVESIGVFGEIPGGGSQASSSYVAAVGGHSHSISSQDQYGAYLRATQDNTGITYTDIDFIGSYNYAGGTTNGSSSGVRSIGGIFSAENGTDADIAILVPATGNDGIVVIGANDISGNADAIIEATGNMEVIGSGNGYIAEADDGERVLMKLVNVALGVYAWDTGTVL